MAEDGARIAWSMHGSGYPVVRVGTFMTHLLEDWDSPVWRHWNRDLGERFVYVRYDERGCGSSSREPAVISLDAWLGDLHGVIEATGYQRVALLGTSHGAGLAVTYAAQHPERVSHIVVIGGYAAGPLVEDSPPEEMERAKVFSDAVRVFWEAPDEFFRGLWAGALFPDADARVVAAMEHLMRLSSTGETAARILSERNRVDIRDIAPHVEVPILVAHARRDLLVPFEHGVELASLLPNASLLALDNRNHIPLPGPAWDTFVAETTRFIGVNPVHTQTSPRKPLSAREHEVLALVADGQTNEAIGEQLALSIRTVERHLSNIYRKLGLEGRTARAAAAGRFHDLSIPGW